MVEIIPTVVPKNFEDVIAAKEKYSSFASALHIDAADGIFAPNTTWLPAPGDSLPDHQNYLYEAHLMVQNPLSVGVAFARSGARRLIAHVETFPHSDAARDTFNMWRSAGVKEIVLAILLTTSLEDLIPYARICDGLLIMTVAEIGKQGAPFDVKGVERVKQVHARYPSMRLSVDGGATRAYAKILCEAGASRILVGSALSKAKDPAKEYVNLNAVCA